MRFLIDAQLPPALARWLTAKGHDAQQVADRHMEAATDGAIWAYAMEAAVAIVTKDEDFAQRKVLALNGPVVVWMRLPNTRRRDCSRGSRRRCRTFCRPSSAAKR